MRTLIIETSTRRGCVALAEDGSIIKQIELPLGLTNSLHLLPAIKELVEVDTLERIVVGVGPGSYTGIRVGAVTAKTLAYALDIPLYGVPTLAGFRSEKGPFAAILDAKISGVYLMLEGGEPQVLPLDEALEKLKQVSTLVTSDENSLRKKLPDDQWDWVEQAPEPLALLEAIKEPSSPDSLELLYLRKTQAELNLNDKS